MNEKEEKEEKKTEIILLKFKLLILLYKIVFVC